jgi:hypothetical protein
MPRGTDAGTKNVVENTVKFRGEKEGMRRLAA